MEYSKLIEDFLWIESGSKISLVGYKKTINLLKKEIELLLSNDSTFSNDSLLITGPTKTGKTTVLKSIATSYKKLNFMQLNASWMYHKRFGNPEQQLRKLLIEAKQKAPTLFFIDDIHLIYDKKRYHRETKEIIADILKQALEDISRTTTRVMIVAATSEPEVIDKKLFDTEIRFPLPSRQDRIEKLNRIASSLKKEEIDRIADATHCYVYKDLEKLIKLAHRSQSGLTFDTILEVLPNFKPTITREMTTPCPPLRWEDIGGVENVKKELQEAVIWPLKYKEQFELIGAKPDAGAILYGPPGCSKTMLAQALATESGYNFIAIKGPELMTKYVGDSEAAVRRLYRNAREIAPCIIFFDEIDGLASSRTDDQSTPVGNRVVSQLLTELNSIEPLDSVFTIAATNRPNSIDSALLRPGRLDTAIYIPLPSENDRIEIFRVHMKPLNVKCDKHEFDHIVRHLAIKTNGYSGAEIARICKLAARCALRENIENQFVCLKHLEMALTIIKPQTRPETLYEFEKFQKKSSDIGQRPSLAPLQFCDEFEAKAIIE